jgi:hypothetical protein
VADGSKHVGARSSSARPVAEPAAMPLMCGVANARLD